MSGHQLGRKSYEDSCRFLQEAGWLKAGVVPLLPPGRPNYDDEQLGVEFFRTRVADEVFENLTLPRTFFGRSEIKDVSFVGTDLSESTLCWNDFIRVNFSNCDLSRSDLRGAIFQKVNFSEANLSAADMRRSDFSSCDFSHAAFCGTKLTKRQAKRLHLSDEQLQEIEWQDSDGEEPEGG
jgi:uncharacterized protein YjbI with pentapeptide repeats